MLVGKKKRKGSNILSIISTGPKHKQKNEEGGDEVAAGDTTAPDDLGLDELYAELQDIEEFGDKDKDDVEGFVAVLDEMTAEERENWHWAVEPVKSTLFKTRKISFKIINSPTLLLPKWQEQLSGTDSADQTLL
ncbi:hypothetical protein F5880DRAFT_1511688 [Lentinula raphanica]|nr:hypothetical protein F5880DRAFT_1511688 [Lentinula raphanica]